MLSPPKNGLVCGEKECVGRAFVDNISLNIHSVTTPSFLRFYFSNIIFFLTPKENQCRSNV